MQLFYVPALVALFLKLIVIVCSKGGQHNSKVFVPMVSVFALVNLAEVLIMINLFDLGTSSIFLIRIFYCASVFSQAFICLYAIEVASRKTGRLAMIIFFFYASVLGMALMFSDLIVAGAVSVGYTVTAIRGEYYSIFQIGAVGSFLFAVSVLFRGYLKATTGSRQIQCAYSLIALMPLVLASILVIFLMYLGYEITGALVLPLASSLFLILSLRSEQKHGLTDIGRCVRPSLRRIAENNILEIARRCLNNELDLRETHNQLEKSIIKQKLFERNGSFSKTAKDLGVHRTTFYSKVRRHGLDEQQ